METFNYHHLRYFWTVAHEGNLTQAADKMNLSQSALSTQIKTLEDRLGHQLFERAGRKLYLTEVGRITLDHADRIFGTGAELLATLRRAGPSMPPLRVGALSTLSRNFQLSVLRPVLGTEGLEIVLTSGRNERLLNELRNLALDLVLTTQQPSSAPGADFVAHTLATHAISLHGRPEHVAFDTLGEMLAIVPVILPSNSTIRTGFNRLTAGLNVSPQIAADVDDMAMVRLLAREGAGLALAPDIVLADELRSGDLVTAPFETGMSDTFYAVTTPRAYPHPMLDELLPT